MEWFNDGSEALHSLVPFAANQPMIDNKATAYICENFACQEPTIDIDQFSLLLGAKNQL